MPEPLGFFATVKVMPYDTGPVSTAKKSIEGLSVSMAEADTQLAMMGSRIGKVSTALGVGLFAAMGVGVGMSIKLEGTMSRLGMVASNLSKKDLGDLQDRFYGIAAVLPLSVNDLAEMGFTLAKLGVTSKKAQGDLALLAAQFAEVGRLGKEEAAESMVLLQKIIDVSDADIKRMTSTIVGLADSSASTAAEIIEVVKRFGSMGRAAGLTQAQILGLVPALKGTGLTARVVGTGLGKIFLKMSTKLDDFAKLMGMTGPQLKQAMEKDALGSAVKFFQALKKNTRSGVEQFQVMNKLGLSGARLAPIISFLSRNTEEVAKFQGMANNLWAEGTALQDKYGVVSETTGAKIRTLLGSIESIVTQMGDFLRPAFRAFLDVGIQVAALFFALPAPIKAVVTVLTLLAGTVLLVTGATFLFTAMQLRARASAMRLAFALGDTNAALAIQSGQLGAASFMWGRYKLAMSQSWKGLKSFMGTIWKSIKAFKLSTAATWLWNTALYANPVGLVVAAIVAMIAVLGVLTYALIKGSKWVKVIAAGMLLFMGPLGVTIVQFYALYAAIKRLTQLPVFQKITAAFQGLWKAVKLALSPFSELTAYFQTAEGSAFNFDAILTSIGEAIAWVGNVLAKVVSYMVPAFEVAAEVVQFLIDSFSFMVEDLSIMGEELWETFSSNISMLWEPISEIFSLIGEMFGFAAGEGQTTGEIMRRIFTTIANFLVVPIKALGVMVRVIGWVARAFGFVAKAVAFVNKWLNPLVWFFRLIAWEVRVIKELLFGSSFLHIKEGIAVILRPLKMVANIFKGWIGIIKHVIGFVSRLKDKVLDVVSPTKLIGSAWGWIKGKAKGVWNSIFGSSFFHIKEGVQEVLPWIGRVANKISTIRTAARGTVSPMGPAAPIIPPAPMVSRGIVREPAVAPAAAAAGGGGTTEVTIPLRVELDGNVIYETVKRIVVREKVRRYGQESHPGFGIGI